MAMAKYFLFVVVLAVSLRNVWTLSPEDIDSIHDSMLLNIVECGKEFGVKEEDLKDLGSLDALDSCFLACVMKTVEMLDDKGMYAFDKALEISKAELTNEEDKKHAEEIINICKSVNDEDVNDGDAGCDRAKLLVVCLINNRSKMFTA